MRPPESSTPPSKSSTGLLEGQIALVTGAGGGIGRGIALRFAAQGAAVAVHCRTGVESAREVAGRVRDSGGRAVVLEADLTDEDACRLLLREAAEWGGGRLTALVNNAGVQPTRSLPGMTAAQWRAVVDTNLSSVFACTQAAAEIMREQGGGSVTHIASIEAGHPAPEHAHYSASKAAVVAHARAAALEYGPHGIRVNTVSPGLIDRDGLAEAWPDGVRRWRGAAPLGRLGRPEDVGDACVFLASPLASWITGHDLVVDGGVSARPTW
ncbi:glucose 1-dehydrogenase [Streptomyces sp. NPDC050997]|uniref:SDR family NAD(P)-dependent oxidoreductase n=1 Tax=Streptomyces sp. NPDC050997 TaxID=3155519 RepID=UPI003416C7B3